MPQERPAAGGTTRQWLSPDKYVRARGAGRPLSAFRGCLLGLQMSGHDDVGRTPWPGRLPLDGPDDELKELGTTFNQLLTRLESSFESQRRFVANASHELRTPLARQRAIGQVARGEAGPGRHLRSS